MPTIR